MKANYRTANGRITFEVEGGSPKELFENLANLQDVFDSDDKCGLCQCPGLRFRVRESGGNKFYELVCLDCNARLSFGQNRQGGGLFPKRRDEHGDFPNRGWAKWDRQIKRPETPKPILSRKHTPTCNAVLLADESRCNCLGP